MSEAEHSAERPAEEVAALSVRAGNAGKNAAAASGAKESAAPEETEERAAPEAEPEPTPDDAEHRPVSGRYWFNRSLWPDL